MSKRQLSIVAKKIVYINGATILWIFIIYLLPTIVEINIDLSSIVCDLCVWHITKS